MKYEAPMPALESFDLLILYRLKNVGAAKVGSFDYACD